MKNSEALNRILSAACPANVETDDKGELRTFHLELHCVEVVVKARPGRRVYDNREVPDGELSEYLFTKFKVVSLEVR